MKCRTSNWALALEEVEADRPICFQQEGSVQHGGALWPHTLAFAGPLLPSGVSRRGADPWLHLCQGNELPPRGGG